ncbi:hypothetical protein VNI00_006682 [Paramarasmius palmivorus]|uniref:Tail specific protease domain-containing protein n=1 Tax=Paramarasmius palmivorus TaxID=297713 RepID=A0AAW0D4I4_9AGAR
MVFSRARLLALLCTVGLCLASPAPADPCTTIAGQKWVSPRDLKACYESFELDPAVKDNIIDVIEKTLAFHTSVNYQIQAPPPFEEDVREDIIADLERIRSQPYVSEYQFHIDVSRALKRLQDAAFVNYLPVPLVLLTDDGGEQNIHIAPEAFSVAAKEFADQIDVWQNSLQGQLKGNLASLNGAKVLAINGKDPWHAVNANAAITGGFQGFGTRQNSFFASYQHFVYTFNYALGDFAQQALPLDESVTLTLVRVNETSSLTVEIPYRARMSLGTGSFTDSASYRTNNCAAQPWTNGGDIYAPSFAPAEENKEVTKFRQQPSPRLERRQLINVMLDDTPLTNIVLPQELQPTQEPLDVVIGAGQFYMLDDRTGVLALGSFASSDTFTMQEGLLDGLIGLKSRGAERLIVDVTNNGGGYICVAHWLHRIIAGPKDTTVPQAGLDTKARNSPLAREIVDAIIKDNRDPGGLLVYNPSRWADASGRRFDTDENWLIPPVNITINGRPDQFSQRLGQECQPDEFTTARMPPDTALFDTTKVAIVSNGRCASSCSLFSITMAKLQGAKTVVFGGKKDVRQQYCGVVGGQSLDFSFINSEIKTTHLKDDPAAPPELLVNGVQGITWRLGFGLDNKETPEEWQDHPADFNLPVTVDIVNNPAKVWQAVAQLVFDS